MEKKGKKRIESKLEGKNQVSLRTGTPTGRVTVSGSAEGGLRQTWVETGDLHFRAVGSQAGDPHPHSSLVLLIWKMGMIPGAMSEEV